MTIKYFNKSVASDEVILKSLDFIFCTITFGDKLPIISRNGVAVNGGFGASLFGGNCGVNNVVVVFDDNFGEFSWGVRWTIEEPLTLLLLLLSIDFIGVFKEEEEYAEGDVGGDIIPGDDGGDDSRDEPLLLKVWNGIRLKTGVQLSSEIEWSLISDIEIEYFLIFSFDWWVGDLLEVAGEVVGERGEGEEGEVLFFWGVFDNDNDDDDEDVDDDSTEEIIELWILSDWTVVGVDL